MIRNQASSSKREKVTKKEMHHLIGQDLMALGIAAFAVGRRMLLPYELRLEHALLITFSSFCIEVVYCGLGLEGSSCH